MFPDQFFLLIKMVVFIYRIRCNYSATNNNLALPFQLNNLVLMGVAPSEKKAFEQCGSVGGLGVVELCMEPVGRNL